jgi:hypothetical protein
LEFDGRDNAAGRGMGCGAAAAIWASQGTDPRITRMNSGLHEYAESRITSVESGEIGEIRGPDPSHARIAVFVLQTLLLLT